MAAPAGVNQYLNNHYDGMTPEQLILMLYKGALDRLELARQGINENNVAKRGENIGKVIAIVSELNCSLDTTMTDESTEFLRGLYTAILTELPRVSVDNNMAIIDRTEKYILKLKEIWETDVMGKSQQPSKTPAKTRTPARGYKNSRPSGKPAARPGGYGGYSGANTSLGSIAV